jgi:hypothetical protein
VGLHISVKAPARVDENLRAKIAGLHAVFADLEAHHQPLPGQIGSFGASAVDSGEVWTRAIRTRFNDCERTCVRQPADKVQHGYTPPLDDPRPTN